MARKENIQLGQQTPRNAGEAMYYERYGTVTPIPKLTMPRKASIQLCSILYIHQGVNLTEACRLTNTDHSYGEKVRVSDKWDEFMQELAQLTKPSNLTLIKALDYDVIKKEAERRSESLPVLRRKETGIINALDDTDPGSRSETILLANLKKIRDLISEATGLDDFKKETSAARQAALVAHAKIETGTSSETKSKGRILDI